MNKVNVDTEEDNNNDNEWYYYEGGIMFNEQNEEIGLREQKDLTTGRIIEEKNDRVVSDYRKEEQEEITIQSYHIGKAIMINNEGDYKPIKENNDIRLAIDAMKKNGKISFDSFTPISTIYDYNLKNELGSTKAKSFIQGFPMISMGMNIGMGSTTGRLESKSKLKMRRSCIDVGKGEVSPFNINEFILKHHAYTNRKEITSISLIKTNKEEKYIKKRRKKESKSKSKGKSLGKKKEVMTQRIIIRKDSVEVGKNEDKLNKKTALETKTYCKDIISKNNDNRKLANDLTFTIAKKPKMQYDIPHINDKNKDKNNIIRPQIHISIEKISNKCFNNQQSRTKAQLKPKTQTHQQIITQPLSKHSSLLHSDPPQNITIIHSKINNRIIKLFKEKNSNTNTKAYKYSKTSQILNQTSNEKNIPETNCVMNDLNNPKLPISFLIQKKSSFKSRHSSMKQLLKHDYIRRANLIKSSNKINDINNITINNRGLSSSKALKNSVRKMSMPSKQFLYGYNSNSERCDTINLSTYHKYTNHQVDFNTSSSLNNYYNNSNKSTKIRKMIDIHSKTNDK